MRKLTIEDLDRIYSKITNEQREQCYKDYPELRDCGVVHHFGIHTFEERIVEFVNTELLGGNDGNG